MRWQIRVTPCYKRGFVREFILSMIAVVAGTVLGQFHLTGRWPWLMRSTVGRGEWSMCAHR